MKPKSFPAKNLKNFEDEITPEEKREEIVKESRQVLKNGTSWNI